MSQPPLRGDGDPAAASRRASAMMAGALLAIALCLLVLEALRW